MTGEHVVEVSAATARSPWILPVLITGFVSVMVGTALLWIGLPGTPPYDPSGLVTFRSDTDKAWVLTQWFFAGTATVVSLVLARRRPRAGGVGTRIAMVVACLGALLSLVLFAWHEIPYFSQWSGFGWASATIALAAAVILLTTGARVMRGRSVHRLLLPLACVIVVLAAIWPLLQTPYTFVTPSDNQFTLDELLAPSIGRMPGIDYIAQYENLLGYPLALIALIVPGAFRAAPDSFAVVWMIVLQVVSLAGIVTAAILATSPRRRWMVPLAIIPVAYLAGSSGLPYYADLPDRLGIPLLLGAAIVLTGRRVEIGGGRAWLQALLVGIGGGVAALNNLDFGVPAALAGIGVVALTAPTVPRGFARAGVALGGVIVVPLAYFGIGAATGRAIHLDYLLYFVRAFGLDNFLAVDIEPFGVWGMYVFAAMAGIVLGVLGIRRRTKRPRVLHLLLFYMSAWLLLSLIYYSGRSLLPTLVSAYSVQLGVIVALLLVIGLDHLRLLRRRPFGHWHLTDRLAGVMVVVLLAVPIASWTVFPPIEKEQTRLAAVVPPAPVAPFVIVDMVPVVAAIPAGTKLTGMIAISGAYWQARLGIRDVSVSLHPVYLRFPSAVTLQCEYLRTLDGDAVLMTREVANFMDDSKDCAGVLYFDRASTISNDGVDEWLLVPTRA